MCRIFSAASASCWGSVAMTSTSTSTGRAGARRHSASSSSRTPHQIGSPTETMPVTDPIPIAPRSPRARRMAESGAPSPAAQLSTRRPGWRSPSAPIGRAGRISIERSAFGIGGLGIDPGQGQRRTVGHGDMTAVPVDEGRPVTGDVVEVVPRGKTRLRPVLRR